MAASREPLMNLAECHTADQGHSPAPPLLHDQDPLDPATCDGDVEHDRGPESHLATLTRAIETEVIPRLLQARRAAPASRRPAGPWQPDRGEVDHFTRLLIHRDEALCLAHLQSLADRGIALETLYSTLLAGAAIQLGTLWDEDLVDFTTVSTGVWRLQKMLRHHSAAFVGPETAPATGHAAAPSILLMPTIGAQHSFGLAIVSEYFRRARWDVTCEIVRSEQNIVSAVRDTFYDVLGFSVATTDDLVLLTRCVASARAASRNRHIAVIVGGPVFVAHPDLVSRVGADATAADAAQAVVNAQALVTSVHLASARAPGA